MEKTDLKPCPFCGGEAIVTFDKHGKWFYIECGNDDCPLIVQGMWHLDMNGAAEEWNRRATNEAD